MLVDLVSAARLGAGLAAGVTVNIVADLGVIAGVCAAEDQVGDAGDVEMCIRDRDKGQLRLYFH